MPLSTYKVHRRALMVLNQLSDAEQRRLQERLTALLEIPVAQWPAVWVKRLQGDQPLYLVRIDDGLRAIMQAEEGQQPELMDLVRHERLESFARAGANAVK
jgi:hypothetical protein